MDRVHVVSTIMHGACRDSALALSSNKEIVFPVSRFSWISGTEDRCHTKLEWLPPLTASELSGLE